MNFDFSDIRLSEYEIQKGFRLPEKYTEFLAEEVGLHLGDGTMNFYPVRGNMKGSYSLRGHILDDREHYETRIKKLYKTIFNLNLSLREMKSTGFLGFKFGLIH